MSTLHEYTVNVTWTGNTGRGTKSYKHYERSHDLRVEGKQTIELSSDSSFMGDPSKHNPEEMLVYAVSSCHMLWYLHLCSVHKVVVEAYTDDAEGTMEEVESGAGAFTSIVLKPKVVISAGDISAATRLHEDAHKYCFIANSLKVPVDVCASVVVK